jgi:hypothetical protein
MEMTFNQDELALMVANSRRSLTHADFDPTPVIAVHAADGPQMWLISELADDGDTAYGLCDLGVGLPECGEVSLAWLAAFRGPLGLPIERLPSFDPRRALTIGTLARMASAAGRIVL